VRVGLRFGDGRLMCEGCVESRGGGWFDMGDWRWFEKGELSRLGASWYALWDGRLMFEVCG